MRDDDFSIGAGSDDYASADVRPAPSGASVAIADGWERSSYAARTSFHAPSALGSLAVVGGIVTALLFLNSAVIAKKAASLTVITLADEPPPPPPEEQPKPVKAQVQPERPEIVVPPPLVTTPAPPPLMAVTTVPTPPPPPLVSANPAPEAVTPARPPAPPAMTNAGDLSSKMIYAKPPSYPTESRRRREEGTVVLALVLGIDGGVVQISVAQSSGSSRLDQAALAAVRRWRWAPATRDGRSVLVSGEVRIPFVLTR